MQLLRQRDIPEDKYSNAFLGYGHETTNFAGTTATGFTEHSMCVWVFVQKWGKGEGLARGADPRLRKAWVQQTGAWGAIRA